MKISLQVQKSYKTTLGILGKLSYHSTCKLLEFIDDIIC